MADEFQVLVRVERRAAGRFIEGGLFAIYHRIAPAKLNALRHNGTGFTNFAGLVVAEEMEVRVDPVVAGLLEEALTVAKAGGR
jgi:hypothetical protein